MVTSMKLAKSSSPEPAGRKKSAMHSHGSLRWRGKVKRSHSALRDSSL